ncbi:MAG TPA: hypothetical protein VGP94_00190, partial [Tepidisphaeraceae bacterium]|nr:hypothetical protein [Tepidisphaeraceae bacterium]
DRPADGVGYVDHLRALFCPNGLSHNRMTSHLHSHMAEAACSGQKPCNPSFISIAATAGERKTACRQYFAATGSIVGFMAAV